MTVLWATEELPGQAFDPEPDDDEDDTPRCYRPDLWGQGANDHRLATMTTLTVSQEYL
ncbi:MAG: hypothetical protein HOV92_00560 [Streptomyces sp.]|nr:hypothetical protein [Streptomyces sp.]